MEPPLYIGGHVLPSLHCWYICPIVPAFLLSKCQRMPYNNADTAASVSLYHCCHAALCYVDSDGTVTRLLMLLNVN